MKNRKEGNWKHERNKVERWNRKETWQDRVPGRPKIGNVKFKIHSMPIQILNHIKGAFALVVISRYFTLENQDNSFSAIPPCMQVEFHNPMFVRSRNLHIIDSFCFLFSILARICLSQVPAAKLKKTNFCLKIGKVLFNSCFYLQMRRLEMKP